MASVVNLMNVASAKSKRTALKLVEALIFRIVQA